jgi:succinate dehydrogenase / fumarate reductase, cytochrome b subunit
METATPGVRHPKGPAKPRKGPEAGAFAAALLDSSVGAKILVALTGTALVLFVVFHMIGNLKVLQGPDAINGYAYFLKHDLGALIWIARGGLLLAFVLHIALALRLNLRSAAARPVAYQMFRPAQAKLASRTMVTTGVVVGLFTLFHLAHYTFAWVKPAVFNVPVLVGDGPDKVREVPAGTPVNYLDLRDAKDPRKHNVHEMMVSGFSNPWIVAIYLVSQVVLFVHLRHGIPSVFQTLGIKNARFRGGIDILGLLVALTILAGNVALVVSVQLGWVKSQYAAG